MILSSYIPKSIKDMLRPLKTSLIDSVKKETVNLWCARGFEKNGGKGLCIAYAGAERHKHYFFKMAFRSYEEVSLGDLALSEIDSTILREYGKVDALFWEAGKENPVAKNRIKYCHFKIPLWVRLELEISKNWDDLKKQKGFVNFKRLHKKNDCEYVTTSSVECFNDFYRKIYAPFTRLNHGDAAFVFSYEEARSKFQQGELLLVKENSESIAGVILEYSLTRCSPICIGIRTDRAHKVSEGLLTAILFEVILRARARQFDKVDLGYSRSFLKDGNFRFKSRLTATVNSDYHKASGFMGVEIFDWSEGLKDFFITNPFLHVNSDEKFEAVFFKEDLADGSVPSLQLMLRDAFCQGIESLQLRIFQQQTPQEFPGIPELGLKIIQALPVPNYKVVPVSKLIGDAA